MGQWVYGDDPGYPPYWRADDAYDLPPSGPAGSAAAEDAKKAQDQYIASQTGRGFINGHWYTPSLSVDPVTQKIIPVTANTPGAHQIFYSSDPNQTGLRDASYWVAPEPPEETARINAGNHASGVFGVLEKMGPGIIALPLLPAAIAAGAGALAGGAAAGAAGAGEVAGMATLGEGVTGAATGMAALGEGVTGAASGMAGLGELGAAAGAGAGALGATEIGAGAFPITEGGMSTIQTAFNPVSGTFETVGGPMSTTGTLQSSVAGGGFAGGAAGGALGGELTQPPAPVQEGPTTAGSGPLGSQPGTSIPFLDEVKKGLINNVISRGVGTVVNGLIGPPSSSGVAPRATPLANPNADFSGKIGFDPSGQHLQLLHTDGTPVFSTDQFGKQIIADVGYRPPGLINAASQT
jgi:hypothetical protein